MKGLKFAAAALLLAQTAFTQFEPPPKTVGEWVNPVTRETEIFFHWSPINQCPDAVWFCQFARTNLAGELITAWLFPTQLLTRPGLLNSNGVFVWDPKFIAFFPPPNNFITRAVPLDLTFFGTPPTLPALPESPQLPDIKPLDIGAIAADGQIVPALQPKPKPKPRAKRKRRH